MKKSNLKVISFFLVIAIMVSLLSVNIFADPITYDISENGDSSLTAVLDTSAYTLTISGSGKMKNYLNYSSVPWYSNRNYIKEVIFEEGCTIESISDYAFYECAALTSIEIPLTVSLIGKQSFYKTSKLSSFVLVGDSTSIFSDSFGINYASQNMGSGVTSGKTATVPAKQVYLIDTLTSFGFEVSTTGNAPTEEEKWSSYPTDAVFEMGSENASDIKAYINKHTGVANILGSGSIADYSYNNSGTHTPISSLLSSIKVLNIGDGITKIGNSAFYYYSSTNSLNKLETLSLPSTLENIGDYAFMNAGVGTTDLVFPKSLKDIGYEAFRSSDFVNISFEENAKIKTIGNNAFYESTVVSVEFPEGLEAIGNNAFYGTSKLSDAILSEGLTTIGDSAFYQSNISEVIIPSTVTYIGTDAFQKASKVEKITILAKDFEFASDSFGESGVYGMGYNVSPKTATVPAGEVFIIDTLTSLGYNVTTTGTATEEDIWNSYPSDAIQEIGKVNATDVIAYKNKTAGVLTVRGTGEIKDGGSYGLISSASSFSKVIIEEGVTAIGNNFMYGNYNYPNKLKEISFPSTLTSIGNGSFRGHMLNEIIIPEGVTYIGNYAFAGDGAVEKVYLPSTLETVEIESFNVKSIKTLVNTSKVGHKVSYNGTETTNAGSIFKSIPITTAYIYSTNTTMLSAFEGMGSVNEVIFLDQAVTSGVLDNGIKWTYDTDTHIITFDTSNATSTELPSYSAGSQPWYGASYAYGGVLGYDFGGVTSFGSGALGGLSYGSSSLTVYGSSNLSSAVGSALGSGYSVSYGGSSSTGGSAGGDIGGGSTGDNDSQDPSTDTSETGIWIYVNDEEVDFPDVQPRVWFGEVYAPLRFINQDLGATVLWNNDTRTATIQRTTDSGKKVEIKLTVGSSSMVVNGKEYTSDEIGMDATVLIEDGRLLLPGRAIVKAWNDVYFKKVYTATAYRDYYYYEDDGLGEEKLEDIEEIENFTETEVIITPDNEQEVLSNYGDTKILVNAESTFFYTSTPILIPIYVDKTGDATIPTDLYIENKCAWGPVVVKNIEFIKANGWEVKAFNNFDFKNTLADSKYIGLTINDVVVGENGSVDMNESLSSTILYKSKKQLTFDAKIPAQRSALKEICAGIVFTVDFDKIVE